MKPMKLYHYVWLRAHPERTRAWFRERLADGFHIHHVDGNHLNHKPENLVLMDGVDHMRLHSTPLREGVSRWRKGARARSTKGQQAYAEKAERGGTWADVAKRWHQGERPAGRIWHDEGMALSSVARSYARRVGLPWPPIIIDDDF